VWGPGAGEVAAGRLCPSHNGQGLQADLSLSSCYEGVSDYEQSNKAHIIAQVSVRTKGTVGESARAEETAIPPELAKDAAVT